jgi:hypothetical protein
MEALQLILPKVMSAKYDQHILDYINFNEEQIEWFEDNMRQLDIHMQSERDEWIRLYIKNFPANLEKVAHYTHID